MLPAAVLARLGMPALAALVFLTVLAVAVACWVISNGDRSDPGPAIRSRDCLIVSSRPACVP